MFTRLIEIVRGVVRRLLGKRELQDIINVEAAVSDKMRDAISLWSDMYTGQAPWVKEPTYDNPERVVSLGLPAFIASEKARMATLEMKSVVTDGKSPASDKDDLTTRAGYLNSQYKKLLKQIRKQLEYGIALGALVIKPYIYVDNSIEFSFTTADNFYPITFDSTGKLISAAFLDSFTDGKMAYTKVELHTLDVQNRTVTVLNTAYKYDLGNKYNNQRLNYLGQEVPLTSIPVWAHIAPEVTISGVDRLLFSYFRMPEANTVDKNSPLGVSAYSRAVSLIKDADIQYSRLLWEFEGGQMAIDIDVHALRTELTQDGKKVEVANNFQRRLYRKVDLNDDATYSVFNPALRDINYVNGLNTIFMRIEDVCGISRGVISDITRSEAKTATEMLILKQRSFAANRDIQTALQYALEDAVYVMNVYCDLYNLAPAGEYHVSYEWDDSLITSPDEELARRLSLLSSGIDSKLNIRMWYFGETEEQAKVALERVDEEAERKAELAAKATGLQNKSDTQNKDERGTK
jgi:A118 family predicted phage portal protein